ncbi:transglycosylase-associated protein [Mizugakiibacter sediminis]|uniref:Transglycosylase n=1 Tax=Mizugakiibacter sediminis TaxID=1475481 RepID=A0A0K8QKN3_9GAMM|nr:GlsB/YeaQ/YmgE family stress response membrane protein [Mizugakiibacter sediminis]GAP65394.1 transglycosylase-associated protein [Mizugakiibacter sediminis]
MLHWIWMFLIGLVIGVVAKFLMPGRDPGGLVVTGLLGIAGSLLAGWLGQALGWYRPGQPAGFIMSVIGALILLFLYRLLLKPKAP